MAAKPSNISISLASPADAEEILSVQKLAFQTEALLYGPEIPAMKQTLESLLEDFKNRTILKAQAQDGRIAGTVRGKLSGDGVCHVGTMAVHPDFRRQGIASRLMKAIEEQFPSAECFELFTGERSYGNIELYKKLGYVEFKRDSVGGVPFVFLRHRR